MDRTIGVSEASKRFPEMLRDVAEGESFIVMSRGRPVGRVLPVDCGGNMRAVADLMAFVKRLPRRRAGHCPVKTSTTEAPNKPVCPEPVEPKAAAGQRLFFLLPPLK